MPRATEFMLLSLFSKLHLYPSQLRYWKRAVTGEGRRGRREKGKEEEKERGRERVSGTFLDLWISRSIVAVGFFQTLDLYRSPFISLSQTHTLSHHSPSPLSPAQPGRPLLPPASSFTVGKFWFCSNLWLLFGRFLICIALIWFLGRFILVVLGIEWLLIICCEFLILYNSIYVILEKNIAYINPWWIWQLLGNTGDFWLKKLFNFFYSVSNILLGFLFHNVAAVFWLFTFVFIVEDMIKHPGILLKKKRTYD